MQHTAAGIVPYPTPPVDLNRGVERRLHPTGVEVYMYCDTPGLYLSAHGKPVPEALAREAGFPVDALAKERRKRELQAAALQEIEQQFGGVEDTISELVKEAGGAKLFHIGLERYKVTDEDGNQLHQTPLAKSDAEALFNKLTKAPIVETPRDPKTHQFVKAPKLKPPSEATRG